MKVISLWMPWANWVSLEWKPIETRTHNRFASLVGQRIAIHAMQKWDDTAIESAAKYLSMRQRIATGEFLRIGGAIICTAFVAAHRELTAADSEDALIDCGTVKRFGLFLRDVEIIPAIPCRGKQGIWNFELPSQHCASAASSGVNQGTGDDNV